MRIPYDSNQVIQDIFYIGTLRYGAMVLNNNLHILLTGTDLTPELVNLAAKLQEENDMGSKALAAYRRKNILHRQRIH